jgi:hypothetical protein
MVRLFLHIGYPKTGTTTLQTSVFDVLHRAKYIRYLGMGGFHRDSNPRRWAFFNALNEALYLEDESEFFRELPRLRHQYSRLINDLPGQGPVVLSNEHFLLSSWSSRQRDARIFPSRTAKRLARLFAGEAVSIIVGTRDLPELVRSMYVQRRSNKAHVHYDRIQHSLAQYVEQMCARIDFTAEMFEFDENRQRYLAAFDNPPMFEISLEELVYDQRRTITALLGHLELPSDAANLLRYPLEHHNAKRKTDTGTVVESLPVFLRPVARNRRLAHVGSALSRAKLLRPLRRMIFSPQQIPNLSAEQVSAIRAAFPVSSRPSGETSENTARK